MDSDLKDLSRRCRRSPEEVADFVDDLISIVQDLRDELRAVRTELNDAISRKWPG